MADWRRLDARIEDLSSEIEALARQDKGCERLMSVPGIGPIISSAMVAAIGAGEAFSKGRDFGAWLGLVPNRGLATLAREAWHVRRPTLTVPARGAPLDPHVGTKERPPGTNEGTAQTREGALQMLKS